MKNTIKVFGIIALVAVIGFSMTACGGGGGKTFDTPEALKAYLDKQKANGPDNPIQVTMNANAPMLEKIRDVLNASGKYVSLNFSGNILTAIPDNAFFDVNTKKGCEMLVGISIPNSVTSIGSGAFLNCTNLASVTIGNSVERIGGDNAFANCTSLASVTIPNSVTSIGPGAFWNCTSLASVTIGNSVKRIGDNAFNNCASLASVTIGNSVTIIQFYAFNNCASLTGITIPNSVTSIEHTAFSKCTSLASVTFEGTIASNNFDNYAFSGLGDIRNKYLAGGAGTYTATAPVGENSKWTKQ